MGNTSHRVCQWLWHVISILLCIILRLSRQIKWNTKANWCYYSHTNTNVSALCRVDEISFVRLYFMLYKYHWNIQLVGSATDCYEMNGNMFEIFSTRHHCLWIYLQAQTIYKSPFRYFPWLRTCGGIVGCGHNINGLMQDRRNLVANALELRPSCTSPSIYPKPFPQVLNIFAIDLNMLVLSE